MIVILKILIKIALLARHVRHDTEAKMDEFDEVENCKAPPLKNIKYENQSI